MSYIIGLTGLIGSGKSTVARYFANCGAGIIDTDQVAHQVSSIGGAAVMPVIQVFGKEFLDKDGKLNRDKLRQLVFDNPDARIELEKIIHPIIFNEVEKQIAKLSEPYIILVVPLLFKSPRALSIIKRSLFVDAEEHLIFERVIKRSNLSHEEVAKILSVQMPRTKQLNLVDDVIINNDNEIDLNRQIMVLDSNYRELALKYNGTL